MHPLPPPPLPLPPPQVDKLLDQQQLLLGMLSSGATLGPPATGAQPGGRGQRQQTKAIAVASPSAEEGHRGDCLRHGLGEGGRDWGKGARGVRKYFSCAEYHMMCWLSTVYSDGEEGGGRGGAAESTLLFSQPRSSPLHPQVTAPTSSFLSSFPLLQAAGWRTCPPSLQPPEQPRHLPSPPPPPAPP